MTAWVHWFAQPWALWLLLALPAVSLLLAWARWRRAQALRLLGTSFLIERLVLLRSRLRRWHSIVLFFGLGALILTIAGPRWGTAEQPDLLGGKDIVVVLDLSKSMLAEQPSRFERARRCLRDLADALEARGGHRIALVVFAAHAKLQFPLTGDYDHFRHALEQLDPDEAAPALRPQAGDKIASGTRIGEALGLAAAAHDPKRALAQDIILLSDGDDPGNDDEWHQGVQIVHRQGLPIHVVAVGDPHSAHEIRLGSDFVRHERKVVQTKLNEDLLQEIARRTNGFYFPAHQSALPLGRLMRGYLEQSPAAADAATDTRMLQSQPRFAWFGAAALLLLGTSMLIGAGPKPTRQEPSATLASAAAMPRWAVAVLLPALVSAMPLEAVQDLVGQGNAAFARQEFEAALEMYVQAAAATTDPGLVAFNQGAALFRMGRFDEAAAHYQRCLDDQAIAPARFARANYDLGTALLRADNKNRRHLDQAIAAFRRCLAAEPSTDLRADAVHNLELAKWLWIHATPAPDRETPNTPDGAHDTSTMSDSGKEPAPRQADGQGAATENGLPVQGTAEPGMDAKQKRPAHGPLQVLPDTDQLVPLPPEDAAAHLDQVARRIRKERSVAWRMLVTAPVHVKDW